MGKAETSQLALEISDGKFVIPQHIFDIHPDGMDIAKIASQRKLWKEKNNDIGIKGLMIFAEKTPELYLINPTSFQVEKTSPEQIIENPQFNCAVIVGCHKDKDLEEFLTKVVKILIPKSPVLVINKKEGLENIDLENIKKVFKKVGLVEKNTLTIANKYDLWEGRKEKTKPKPKSIDFLFQDEKGNYKYPWAITLFESVIKSYEEQGFKIIDPPTSALFESMKNTNYPRLISNLDNGFGVRLEGVCGCMWNIDLHGTRQKTKQCLDDNSCLGVPEYNSFFTVENLVKEMSKHINTDRVCWECGSKFERDVEMLKLYGRKGAKLQIKFQCSGCGENDKYSQYYTKEELTHEWIKAKESVLAITSD